MGGCNCPELSPCTWMIGAMYYKWRHLNFHQSKTESPINQLRWVGTPVECYISGLITHICTSSMQIFLGFFYSTKYGHLKIWKGWAIFNHTIMLQLSLRQCPGRGISKIWLWYDHVLHTWKQLSDRPAQAMVLAEFALKRIADKDERYQQYGGSLDDWILNTSPLRVSSLYEVSRPNSCAACWHSSTEVIRLHEVPVLTIL